MVVRLTKILHARPPASKNDAFVIRSFGGPDDIQTWLSLRQRAFAGQIAAGRPWTEADFRREFLEKAWWRPERMWFAEEKVVDGPLAACGAAALAVRGAGDALAASIQWLLVLPDHRRRGIGSLLMNHLEIAAWEAGCREITAETLGAWEAAVRFYRTLGYKREKEG